MSKTEKLFDLINYVNTKRKFTANDVAEEFGISLRTAHRYLLELDHMGVPLYTEQGRNGGYRTLQGRMLPPIIFNEDEALAIFFAFQSLQFYKSLPFEVDIKSASRKLFLGLPGDVRPQVENLKSVLAFWNRERDIETPFLKILIEKASQKKALEIQYQSMKKITNRVICPIGVYANEGMWYVPSFDYDKEELRLFRADRIIDIKDAGGDYPPVRENLYEYLYSYEIKDPVHLYVELSDRGLLLCKDDPYLGKDVQNNPGGPGGFIDTVIDREDIEFTAHSLMNMGEDAQVIEPQEMKEYIVASARKMLKQYE